MEKINYELIHFLKYELRTEPVHFKMCELNFELVHVTWTFPTLVVYVLMTLYM